MSGVLKERDYKNLKQHSIDGSEWKRLVEIVNSISSPVNVGLPPNASTLTEQEYQSALLEQLKVSILSYSKDFFGNTVTSQIHNQIEVPFDDTNWADYVNLTNVSTGAATQANGEVTLTTGTNANGRYAAISKDIVKYRPNHEIGFGFTWRFNTASITNVTLSIGSTDNITTWANGVFFRHKNGIFSLVYTRGGAEIWSKPQSQWIDKCDGLTGSEYKTADGSLTALDITKDQLCRIHCGLFGHAGFTVELLAPNQQWVTIATHTNINNAVVPVFSNFDLSIGAEVKKASAGSGIYTLSSACWGGWTGSSFQRMNATITDRSLVQLVRSVITGRTSAGGGNFVDVKVNPSGSLETANAILEGNSASLLARSSGSILSGVDWSYFSVAYPNITTDVYSYFIGGTGGTGGTLVRTVTITYTDATRNKISKCWYA